MHTHALYIICYIHTYYTLNIYNNIDCKIYINVIRINNVARTIQRIDIHRTKVNLINFNKYYKFSYRSKKY